MHRTVLGDRYTLLEVLGGGGMAQVFLAHDDVLDRDVALKVLREQYADDKEFVERFRREAKNAAALNHPNVVQIYDQGRANDSTYYMAMEYIPGGTLKDRMIREGPLKPDEAIEFAARVADALSVAHDRGIIHRDIKPQNVLLTTANEAKVADFGIARAASSKTMTEANLMMGTAAYMSPEQARGDRVGPASDLYSLGVVLYEMLTGELPYTANDPIATAIKHLNEPPRHPRDANPSVPEELDALVAKLLAKNPEDRYASAAELAADLRRIRPSFPAADPGGPTTVRMSRDTGKTRVAPAVAMPGGTAEASGVPGRRRRLLPLMAALLLGIVLLGGIAWSLSRGAFDGAGSGSQNQVKVPRVVGQEREEAQKRLDDAGLRVGSEEEATSDAVEAGVVIEQNPAPGAEAERGTAVDLVVATGPAQEPTASPTASPAASPTASPTASPSGSPSASPASDEEAQRAIDDAQKAAQERQKQLEEAARKAVTKESAPKRTPGGNGHSHKNGSPKMPEDKKKKED